MRLRQRTESELSEAYRREAATADLIKVVSLPKFAVLQPVLDKLGPGESRGATRLLVLYPH